MERTDPADPTPPMESTEPIDPTDKTELREPMDRTESRDQSDHREPLSRSFTEPFFIPKILEPELRMPPYGGQGGLRRADGIPAVRRNDQTGTVLLIDAANVVGSRPTGWWRDRAGAARAFVDQVRAAVDSGRVAQPVVVILEGKAREAAQAGLADGVTVLHAPGSGDDLLIEVASNAIDQVITVVTADRELRQRAEALGAHVVGPGWLLERLE